MIEVIQWIAIIIGIVIFWHVLCFLSKLLSGNTECQLYAKTQRRYNDAYDRYYDYQHKVWFMKPEFVYTQPEIQLEIQPKVDSEKIAE